MFEPFLSLILITLLALSTLLAGLPELLTWLAGRNIRQRRELIQTVRRLEHDLKIAARQVEPFRELQAPQYRHIYQTIADLLRQVQSNRQALVAASTLRFPHLPMVGWPVQHFVSYPQDAAHIVMTAHRLRQLRNSLDGSNQALATVQKRLDQLRSLPEQFRRDSEALLGRLEAVEALLQEEQKAGIATLAEWSAEHVRLQHQSRTVEQQLRRTATLSLEEADRLGQELDALEAAVAKLEQGLRALHNERLALDAQQQAIRSAWTSLGQLPQALRPIAEVIETLLEEAAILRRQTAFAQAVPLLKAGQPWIELARTFQATAAQVEQLLPLQNDALNPAAVEQVQHGLQRAYERLAALNPMSGRQAYAPLSPTVLEALTLLEATLAQIQAQARSVQERYRQEAREQEQLARSWERELSQAWNQLGRVMKLDRNDRLAKEYHALLAERKGISGRPAPLRAWIWKAAELQQDVVEATNYLRYRLAYIGQWVAQLPEYVTTLTEDGAEAWACLEQPLANIQRHVSALQQRWKKARTGWLDETHEELDAMKLQYQQLQQDFQGVDHNLYQLNELHGRIVETMQVIGQTADNMDPARYNRVVELVEANHQRAFLAVTCEEAIELLRKAEDFASQLAMG